MQAMTDLQTLRGKMWRTFLGLEAVKQEGYYESLVYQALGNKYSKRKVTLTHVVHNTFCSTQLTSMSFLVGQNGVSMNIYHQLLCSMMIVFEHQVICIVFILDDLLY